MRVNPGYANIFDPRMRQLFNQSALPWNHKVLLNTVSIEAFNFLQLSTQLSLSIKASLSIFQRYFYIFFHLLFCFKNQKKLQLTSEPRRGKKIECEHGTLVF